MRSGGDVLATLLATLLDAVDMYCGKHRNVSLHEPNFLFPEPA